MSDSEAASGDEHEMLVCMGFDGVRARLALKEADGDFDGAVAILEKTAHSSKRRKTSESTSDKTSSGLLHSRKQSPSADNRSLLEEVINARNAYLAERVRAAYDEEGNGLTERNSMLYSAAEDQLVCLVSCDLNKLHLLPILAYRNRQHDSTTSDRLLSLIVDKCPIVGRVLSPVGDSLREGELRIEPISSWLLELATAETSLCTSTEPVLHGIPIVNTESEMVRAHFQNDNGEARLFHVPGFLQQLNKNQEPFDLSQLRTLISLVSAKRAKTSATIKRRSDEVAWWPVGAGAVVAGLFFPDRLVQHLEQVAKKLFPQRRLICPQKVMLARYGENGSFYAQHRDNEPMPGANTTFMNHRAVTCILYLWNADIRGRETSSNTLDKQMNIGGGCGNSSCPRTTSLVKSTTSSEDSYTTGLGGAAKKWWEQPGFPEGCGGRLRAYDPAAESPAEDPSSFVDIAPDLGTAVFFDSKEVLHQVLPCYGERVALTFWMLEGGC